jgi:ferrous iron transport protein B
VTKESFHKAKRVLQTAVIGNVCVGKTSIFQALCLEGDHPVNIPGSTMHSTRGVMAVGSFGAPRSVRRRCSACGVGKKQRSQCGEIEPISLHACPGAVVVAAAARRSHHTPALIHLHDTPGSQTLAADGEDEMVARDLLLSGEIDSLLVTLDAKNLRRSIAFFLEAREFELPTSAALNMVDEAEAMGIDVDEDALARELGVSVVSTVAVERRGIRKLAETIPHAAVPSRRTPFPKGIEKAIGDIERLLDDAFQSCRGLALLLLSLDNGARRKVEAVLGPKALEQIDAAISEAGAGSRSPIKELLRESFYEEAKKIVERVSSSQASVSSLLARFGSLSQRLVPGIFIAAAVMIAAYYWIGVLGAGFVVDTLLERGLNGIAMPAARTIFAHIPSAFVRDAFLDPDFGMLPSGLFLALGIVLPVLFFFYLFQAVLEDSGYLPRLAVLLDRVFRRLGLSGQSLIPLLLGFSCITMAVITTRMLPTKRERIILTLLLILGIPCAPLLAVMLVILRSMPPSASIAVFGTILMQIALIGFLASLVLPGVEPDLIMEIPKMRIPRPRMILRKTWRRSFEFIKEALPIFLIASFAVFLFNRAGGLRGVEYITRPFIHGVLGLPDAFVQVFIKTVIRRENGAAELLHVRGQFNHVQLVVAMLVMTFLMPCINATIVIFKERGIKTSLAILGFASVWAMVMGALVNFVCKTAGITFM